MMSGTELQGSMEADSTTPETHYQVSDEMTVRLGKTFTYHPVVKDQQRRYVQIRETARSFAILIADACPESREKSTALTKLQETVMWANAAIAINE